MRIAAPYRDFSCQGMPLDQQALLGGTPLWPGSGISDNYNSHPPSICRSIFVLTVPGGHIGGPGRFIWFCFGCWCAETGVPYLFTI